MNGTQQHSESCRLPDSLAEAIGLDVLQLPPLMPWVPRHQQPGVKGVVLQAQAALQALATELFTGTG